MLIVIIVVVSYASSCFAEGLHAGADSVRDGGKYSERRVLL
jgi:hypothetical protein